MEPSRGWEQGLEDWDVVRRFLPEGWEEQAKKSGALKRARGVRSAEALLRILLIHLAAGCSLIETSTRARASGLGQLSSVALFKRLRSSEEWLRWMAERMWYGRRGDLPQFEGRIRAVDATVVSEPGSRGTDWRVHYSVDLRNLQCDFFELTDRKGGETWRRFPVQRGEVLLGDRAYGSPPGVAHVLHNGGEVLVRINLTNLPLFAPDDGKRVDPLEKACDLEVGEIGERAASVRSPEGDRLAGRLIAIRKSLESARVAQEKILREARRKKKEPGKRTLEAARFFFVWTSLSAGLWSAEKLLELYRVRWQVELAFKRMKSILGLGHLPKKDPGSARAWLHGKILVSLLIERTIEAADAFSPWGYPLGGPSQSLEGNRVPLP